jgi:hypothetical protein
VPARTVYVFTHSCEADRHADAHTDQPNCLTMSLWASPFGSGRLLALLGQPGRRMSRHAGAPIVLTAPSTKSIDHPGFFIQMSLASIPGWMEWVIDKKYLTWRDVPRNADGRAGTAPARARGPACEGVWRRSRAVCYPDQLPDFIGEVDGRESRAIEEFGCAVAPLVLFALFWVLADSAPRPTAWARLA